MAQNMTGGTLNPTSAQPNNVQSASLYVGDLKPEVTEALLFEIFNAVGPVASIRVCRNAITRKSLGYAYVNFHNIVDAERALDTMNFTSIRGRPCRIMWSMRDPTLRKSGKGNIFVKNLDPSIDHKTLYDTFSMFGDILSCKVAMKDGGDGNQVSVGYGFVHYSSEEAAKNAINKVNGMEIAHKTVVVEEFKAREQRADGDRPFTNVYLKNLPEGTSKEDLLKIINQACKDLGDLNIESAYVKDQPHHFFKACWGCVDFKDAEQAKKAVELINGNKMNLSPENPEAKELEAYPFQTKSQRSIANKKQFESKRAERLQKYAGVNVYIKNLHDSIDDDRLKQEFSQFGEITSARVMLDTHGRSKGFGFVSFKLPDQATKAITEMNTKIVEGKPLYVALHQPRAIRDAQLAQRFSHQRNPAGMGGFGGGGPGMGGRPGMWNQNQQARMMMGGRGYPGPGPMGYNQMPSHVGGGGYGGMQTPQGFAAGGYGQQPMPFNNRNRMRQPRGAGRDFSTPGGPQLQQHPGPMPNALQTLPAQPQQLNAKTLTQADPQQQKQMIGERVFPLVQQREPKLAGKITGMLLEMDNTELLHLLESPQSLSDKINEALAVLREHQIIAQSGAE